MIYMLQHTMANMLETNNKNRMPKQRKHLTREIEDIESNVNFRTKPINKTKGQWMKRSVDAFNSRIKW